ncbi:MAG: hypothetical protein JST66_08910 [Bacteroidetes bacterium]|nr:hypothetical protein [Bacteroidota bacterium]
MTPQAYVYLRYPMLSSGETMLYHTIQHLCFTGALAVAFREVAIGGREGGRRIDRLFLSRNRHARDLSSSEAFAWGLLPDDRAITLGDLRRTLDQAIEDYERFKYEHMLPDLKALGLLSGRHQRTAAGRAACRRTRDLLFTVQQDIGRRLDGGWERSLGHVQELGSAIVLLNDDTRGRLKEASSRKADLVAVFSILTYLERSSAASTRDGHVVGFGGSDGGYSGGGGGFGGFGGGSFGGGGAGGSW